MTVEAKVGLLKKVDPVVLVEDWDAAKAALFGEGTLFHYSIDLLNSDWIKQYE